MNHSRQGLGHTDQHDQEGSDAVSQEQRGLVERMEDHQVALYPVL